MCLVALLLFIHGSLYNYYRLVIVKLLFKKVHIPWLVHYEAIHYLRLSVNYEVRYLSLHNGGLCEFVPFNHIKVA